MRRARPTSRTDGALRGFRRSDRAMAAVEFAMLLPVLLLFMLGAIELTRFVNVARTLTSVANSLATQMASRTTDDFNYNEAVFTFNSVMITFPGLLKDAKQDGVAWYNDIAVTLSSIAFTSTVSSCTSNCTYTAKVAWSISSPTAATRSCSVAPVAAPNSDPPSLTKLPQDVFNAGSIVVADVIYVYTPIFASRFIPAITLKRSVYLSPRYLALLHYTVVTGDPGFKSCS